MCAAGHASPPPPQAAPATARRGPVTQWGGPGGRPAAGLGKEGPKARAFHKLLLTHLVLLCVYVVCTKMEWGSRVPVDTGLALGYLNSTHQDDAYRLVASVADSATPYARLCHIATVGKIHSPFFF